MLFAFEWVLPFNAGWTQERKREGKKRQIQIYNIKIWNLFSLSMNPFALSTVVSIYLLLPERGLSQPCSLPPVDGTAAKLSGSTAHQFQLPATAAKEKSVNVFVSLPLALRAFSAVAFRGQMQCVWHRERISITNMLKGQWPAVPSPLSAQWRFPFLSLSLFKLHSCCPENTNDHGFGDKQPKTEDFRCLSLFVLKLLRLRAIKSRAYILYYYVCLPLTYQKVRSIN